MTSRKRSALERDQGRVSNGRSALRARNTARGTPRPRRGQGRSHKECARSVARAGILWEGSSDPDSGGGLGAAPVPGPVGSNRHLPTGRSLGPGTKTVGASLLAIAASIKAGGRQPPHREQARSHKDRARPAAGALVLWEGSSDPDSGGGLGAAPARAYESALQPSTRATSGRPNGLVSSRKSATFPTTVIQKPRRNEAFTVL